MEITIDARKLYNVLSDHDHDEDRGRYMILALCDIILRPDGRGKGYPWVVTTEELTPKKRTKNYGAPKCKGDYTPEFESFWAAYPRKVGKGAAFAAWCKVNMDKKELETNCVLALEWQSREEQWVKDDGKFIPHPQTYLNQRRWEDEKPVKPHATESVMGIGPSSTGRKMVL